MTSPRHPAARATFIVGDEVEGLWEDGKWYAATILAKSNDTYKIRWAEYNQETEAQPAGSLRPLSNVSWDDLRITFAFNGVVDPETGHVSLNKLFADSPRPPPARPTNLDRFTDFRLPNRIIMHD